MLASSEKDFFNREYEIGRREAVGQFYSIIANRSKYYKSVIQNDVAGKSVLEYGCGEGSHSVAIAAAGGKVTGIDISDVGIRNARQNAQRAGIADIHYIVMDAENMSFYGNAFDLIIGEGILHHLDLSRAMPEISRVLQPQGSAVFMEPLGHNPAINWYRSRTPDLRTVDEHPLLKRDIHYMSSFFEVTRLRFFHLLSFAAMPLIRTRLFHPFVNFFDKIDYGLFRICPPAGYLSWYVILEFAKPRKEA